MNQQEIRENIENILDNSAVGVMATVQQNKPHSRYMTFHRDGLTLYTATNNNTHKTEEIKENPHTHILLGYEGEGFGDEYVEYEGKVSISQSDAMKKKLWNEYMESWFSGPDDPDYIVLEITPQKIHLMNKKNAEPRILNL
ncbi:pyridoxamine 5'-phosphate oxidase family protein [Virgibacillus siamensis]|uniref:pyridoxamine 5'-phosphate oxidase family protein n=1 Tax=Virgibacillus siamensis TaxID=480071 RepID=UPI00098680DA|nr:pyridoxamine 5'-phosphate oxidase family protein [Virgibacillus siamensis]